MVSVKNIILVLFASALLVFAGCSGGADKSNGYSGSAFKGGVKALDVQFAEGNPPAKVMANGRQPFNIRLMIENVGEYDINDSKTRVVLTGINPGDFGLSDADTVKTVNGLNGVEKIKNNIKPGQKQVVTFSNLKYLPNILSGSQQISMFVDVCYPYKTTAIAKLCISGNTNSVIDDEDKVCVLDEKKSSESSGAPIVVENVQQFSSGDGIQFQFDIVHKGEGRIYRKESLDSKCQVGGNSVATADAAVEENFVNYKVITGIQGLDCGDGVNVGAVQLVSGKATVYCTQKTLNEGDYEKPITIELFYDYFDRKKTAITVEYSG